MAKELSVPVEELQKIRLMIASPMYGGQCSGFFVNSALTLSNVLNQYKIPFGFHFIFNESLIPRARNYCAESFLSSDANFTHLLFIDSDIEFSADAVMTLLALSILNKDKGIFCGIYPKKNIAWEKVKAAVDAGRADTNPFALEDYTGDFVIGRMISDKGFVGLDEIVEVAEAGTGFMLIKREVLETFQKSYPELMYKPDHMRSKEFNGEKEICQFFNAEIDPETRRYLSEDYFFCHKAKKIGYGTWIAPWITLDHVGTYKFKGNLAAVAGLGQSLTVDPEIAKKQQKLGLDNF